VKLKTRVLLFLILAALARAPHAAGQESSGQSQTPPAHAAKWARYTYPGEEFSAELPAMPWAFHTRRLIRDGSSDGEQTRVFGLYSGGVVYMIVSFYNPRDAESDERLANYSWGGRGLTRKEGDVKLAGMSGHEYDISLYSIKGTARFFRTKGRAYLLEAFSDAAGHGEAFERFLNSFTLGAKPAGEPIADDPRGAAAAAGGDGPYRSAELVQKAVIVYKPEPSYTEEARSNNVAGVVRLRAIFTSSGKVTDISVVKGLPDGLTEKAIAAARHILFFPARKDDREVSQYVVLEYNFNFY
jgi:TonB family protein